MSKTLNTLTRNMRAGRRCLLVGPPGCGKTARILQAASECGRRVITSRCSLMERVDIGGCMVPDAKSHVTRQLPLELVNELRNTEESILWLLDDLGQAPIDVQSSLMCLFDNQWLSPSVLVWGATNRPQDKAGVFGLSEPLRSRFHARYMIATPDTRENTPGVLLGDWSEEVSGWCEYAALQGFPPEILAWHMSTNGKTLYAWTPSSDPCVSMPDYRGWETVARGWDQGFTGIDDLACVLGKPVALEFHTYCRLAQSLPCIDQIWIDPTGSPVPEDVSSQWLVLSMVASKVTIALASPFFKYITRFSRPMTAFAGLTAIRRIGASVAVDPTWRKWMDENHTLFI